MADVAARAGVSRALVSTVFRGVPGASAATRAAGAQAAAELGYQVDNRARLLRRSRTRLVGVVFRVQDAFHAELVEALYPGRRQRDYNVVLSGTTAERSEIAAAESLLNDRCEALVLVSPQMPDAELGAWGSGRPRSCSRGESGPRRSTWCMTADLEVVRTALDHLISLGHRNIAHLDGRVDPRCHRPPTQLPHAHASARPRRSTSRSIPEGTPRPTGCVRPQLVAAEAHPPTAIIAFNDRVGGRSDLRAPARRSQRARGHQHHRIRRHPHGHAALRRPHHRRAGRHRDRPAGLRGRLRPSRRQRLGRNPGTRLALPRRTQHHRRAGVDLGSVTARQWRRPADGRRSTRGGDQVGQRGDGGVCVGGSRQARYTADAWRRSNAQRSVGSAQSSLCLSSTTARLASDNVRFSEAGRAAARPPQPRAPAAPSPVATSDGGTERRPRSRFPLTNPVV